MIKSFLASVVLAAVALSAHAYPAPTKTFSHPSDQILTVQSAGYQAHFQGNIGAAPLSNAADIAHQASIGPNVTAWMGKEASVLDPTNFSLKLYETTKYPNITHIYVKDEFCWAGVVPLQFPCPGDSAILGAAQEVRMAGKKATIVMMPQAILAPGFGATYAPYVNAFDTIAIDIYPSMLLDTNTYGCTFGTNIVEDFLQCSIDRLRGIGYTGKIGYIYQGFVIQGVPDAVSLNDAAMQRVVLDWAKAGKYDIDSIMPWGLYLGAGERAVEPSLIPLGGTPFEYLVAP